MNSLSLTKVLRNKKFLNADQETVEYDGSELSWRVSAYAVIVKNEHLFIIKNKLEKLHDIVGGGIEFGETIEEALNREGMEEGGLEIQVGKLLDIHMDWFYHRKGAFHQTIQLFYEATLKGELGTPTEQDIEWVGFVDLKKIGNEYRLPNVVEEIIQKFYV